METIVYGFEFSCKLSLKTALEANSLLNEFIGFVESVNLEIGGGIRKGSFEGFITRYENNDYVSTTDEDRTKIARWLHMHKCASLIYIGNLVDANAEDESFYEYMKELEELQQTKH